MRWRLLAIALFALASSFTGLANRFAFDDLPIIVRDQRIHRLDHPGRFFTQPYWGPPAKPGLYRPLTSLSFAVQWAVGRGSALPYHVLNVLLYILICLAVLRLAALLAGPTAGWWAAALFAVHPVHVEAVATGVGQSELWASLLVVTAVICHIRFRRRGDLATRHILLVAGLYLAGCLFKENAIMLPALLVAAELTVLGGSIRKLLGRRDLRLLGAALTIMALGFWTVHAAVSRSLAGDHAALAFHGMNMGDRLFTMLGVVPEWFRLLLWPAQLKVEYLPQEIRLAHSFGLPQLAGAVLLAGTTASAIAMRRRRPAFTFGVLWTAVAIFPVSNVLIPSGVLLAERTLFLPSAGVVLVLGSVVAWAAEHMKDASRGIRWLAITAGGALLLTGVARSALRQPVWRSAQSFHDQLLLETPNSYRSHWSRAVQLTQAHDRVGAEREYAKALELFSGDPQLLASIADRERGSNRCDAAVEHYRRSLLIDRTRFYLRQRLIGCLIKLGRLDEARTDVRQALANHERGAKQDSILVEQAAP